MNATGRWVVLQHVAYEGPGTIAPAVSDLGAQLAVARIDRGDPVPAPGAVAGMAGLVVMGGPMSVHDAAAWLSDERALLRAAVKAGLPVLGVCLGAQQLAAALPGHLAQDVVQDPPVAVVLRLHRGVDAHDHAELGD